MYSIIMTVSLFLFRVTKVITMALFIFVKLKIRPSQEVIFRRCVNLANMVVIIDYDSIKD